MLRSRIRVIVTSISVFSLQSLLPKILSVAKDMAVAKRFGASEALDLYLMAFVLIGVPISVVVVALQTTLIPALVERSERDSAANLLGAAVKLATTLLGLALPIWLIVLPLFLHLVYPENHLSSQSALLRACMLLIPYYFINGINILFYGALQARKIFWANAVLPGLFPISILLFLHISTEADMEVLVGGTVMGSAMECAILLILLNRNRLISLRRTSNSGLLNVGRLAIPIAIGGVLTAFSPVIEQLIAYRLGAGEVSILNYGLKIPAALSSLLVSAIGIIALPHFAELIQQHSWSQCRSLYLKLCSVALVCGIVVASAFAIASSEFVRILFERGAFTSVQTASTAMVMRMYLVQLPFLLVSMVSARVLIALNRTVSLTVVSAAQIALAFLLSLTLSRILGVAGVALGTTSGAIFAATALFCLAFFNLVKRKEYK